MFPTCKAGYLGLFLLSVLPSCAGTQDSLSLAMIRFYQRDISPIDGPRSSSAPTGTNYGLEAYTHYGFFTATTITAARLLQEYDRPKFGLVTVYGMRRKFDPLISNVYWWDDQARFSPEPP